MTAPATPLSRLVRRRRAPVRATALPTPRTALAGLPDAALRAALLALALADGGGL